MTEDEYLDSMKRFGYRIYRCPTCQARAMGAAVTYHEMAHKDHPAMDPEKRTSRDLMDRSRPWE